MREDDREREHCAEIVDEAGGQDDLSHPALVEAGLDHDRVNHRDRVVESDMPAISTCGQDQSME